MNDESKNLDKEQISLIKPRKSLSVVVEEIISKRQNEPYKKGLIVELNPLRSYTDLNTSTCRFKNMTVNDLSILHAAENFLQIPEKHDSLNKKGYLSKNFASKISSLYRRNKLRKDKKTAHFLFILVFTFFFCWVSI